MTDTRHPNPSSGSETRRRCHQVGVRLLPEEWAKLTAHAEAAGEFPGTVLRRAYFPEPPDEPTERDVEALVTVLRTHRPRIVSGTRLVVCACEDQRDRSKRVSLAKHESHVAGRLARLIAEARREGAADELDRRAGGINPGDHHCFKPWCPHCAVRKGAERERDALRKRAAALRGGA